MDFNKIPPFEDMVVDPQGSWIHTVGSINGDVNLLSDIIDRIEYSYVLAKNDKVVFLGNFIGTEGSVRETLHLMASYRKARPNQVVILRGKNEHFWAASKTSFFKSDLGKQVVKEYRVKALSPFRVYRNNMVDSSTFMKDRAWLAALPAIYLSESGKYCFVHSGLDPDNSLSKQTEGSAIFVKDKFYECKTNFGRMIIHGRNGIDKPEYRLNRIGIAHSTSDMLKYAIFNDSKDKPMKTLEEHVSVARIKKSSAP